MGLFSKNKDDMPATPVMPPAMAENSSNLAPPAVEGTGNLSAPPIPGGNLDDIKSQVQASAASAPVMPASAPLPPINDMGQIPDVQESAMGVPNIAEETEVDSMNLDDESLFDFSELDLDTPQEVPEEAEKEESVEAESSPLDDLSFIKKNRKIQDYETFFITTKQFKSLLEIVDLVKKKVKNASETHLRLMDIKAEEDIEYENLRKDFEFIEDKLYEVDNLIFEKQ